jgi:PIN domain nuclease of toxin-antitoxin system
VRLLLDTQIAIWAINDSKNLSQAARNLIADMGNEIIVSVASLWEIAIKYALGPNRRQGIPIGARRAHDRFQSSGYNLLQITPAHVHALENLPTIHGDPFDRLLLAQAYETPLRFVTHDRTLRR